MSQYNEEASVYTIAAFLLGLFLTSNLTSTEQNALGNWLMLVSQTLCTNGSYNFNKEWGKHAGSNEPNIKHMLKTMNEQIERVSRIIK